MPMEKPFLISCRNLLCPRASISRNTHKTPESKEWRQDTAEERDAVRPSAHNGEPVGKVRAEDRSTRPGAHPGEREPYAKELTPEEARKYLPETFLRGSNGWDPIVAEHK